MTDISLVAPLTLNLISPKSRRVVRKKTNFEQMPGRFGDGTFARIDAVLETGENRSDFLRAAVEREIKRRERAKPKDAD